MPATDPVVLLTRPHTQAAVFRDALMDALNPTAKIIIDPVIDIAFLPSDAEIAPDEVLFLGSVNAACAVDKLGQTRGQTALCIGDITTTYAQNLGLRARKIGNSLADGLGHLPDRFTWVRGAEVSLDLQQALGASCQIKTIIGYRQTAKALQKTTLQILASQTVIAPVFSTNSARHLVSQLGGVTVKSLTLIAISPQVAGALAAIKHAEILVLSEPTRTAMIAKMAESL